MRISVVYPRRALKLSLISRGICILSSQDHDTDGLWYHLVLPNMAEPFTSTSKAPATTDTHSDDIGLDAAIPKGEVDSIYEAKARVLNAAVKHAAARWWFQLTR